MDLEKLRKNPEIEVIREWGVPIAFSSSSINYMVYKNDDEYFLISDISIDLYPKPVYFDEKTKDIAYKEEYNPHTGKYDKLPNPFVNFLSFEQEKEKGPDIEMEL